ncbi:MAG: 50S ribosomal protein L30 [Deltaproteobacteria bacterium]|nr:50S ribosomal protein L30 [Deltaproteobacteria bacterium]
MTKIKVTQVRSTIGRPAVQALHLKGLGLRKIGHTVFVKDTPSNRGLVRKVQHLVEVQVHAGDVELSGRRHQK